MKTTIELACEAGAKTPKSIWPPTFETSVDFTLDALKRFEALIRADEREECAKVCEDNHEMWRWDNEPDSRSGPRDCADAIRARGNA